MITFLVVLSPNLVFSALSLNLNLSTPIVLTQVHFATLFVCSEQVQCY
jgi:hypothetical protein